MTTLKTLSMYLRASKTDAEEAGESTEGMAESVSKLRSEILALTGQQVDIMQSDGKTYKNTYQILKELSQVWKELDDVTQANLTEMIGGKRNANAVTAILTNFDIAEQALINSQESAGSALRENDKYLESINGKLDQMKSSFQELSYRTLDSGLVKGIVDAARGTIDALNAIDEVTSGASSKIIGFVVIVSTLRMVLSALGSTKIFASISLVFEAITTGATTAGTAIKQVAAAAGLFSKSNYIALGLTALGYLIPVVKKAIDNAHPSMEQLKADFEEASSKAEDYKSQQEEVNAKIEELHQRQANGERTAEIEGELSILKSQNQALETQIKLYEDLAKVKNAEIEKQKSEEAENYFAPRGSAPSQYDSALGFIETYRSLTEAIGNSESAWEIKALEKQRKGIQEWLTKETEIIRGFIDDPTYGKEASSLVELISSVILGGMDDLTDGAEQKADDLADAIIPKTVDTVKKQMSVMEDAVDEYAKYGGLTSDTIDDLKANIPGLVDALYDQNGELTEAGKAALKSDSALRTFAEDAIKAAKKVNGMSFDEAKKKLQELETVFYATAIGSRTMAQAMEISDLKKAIAEAQADIEATINGWSKYNPDAGKSGSSKDKFKEGLENRLKILKHQLEMERITQEQYYAGVASVRAEYQANAWRDEYKYEEEITDLEEELFSGRLSILDDFVNDYEHEIEKLTDNGKIGQAQALYVATLARIDQEMQWAIENGLDRNGDFMQKLEQQWRDTASKITEITKSMFDEYESYADDFNMWGKKGFSKNDFYDAELSQLEEMYKKGYYTSAEYLDRYNEIQKKRFDFHNESLNEIIDLTIEMIEKETDEVADAIDEEIDAYDELINKKKELLRNAEDEADYEEEVAEAVREIAKLQSKISQLSLDSSREAAAKRANLEEQLAEKQKELNKTQRDHALEQTNEALDESLDAFKAEKEAEKKTAEESIGTWMEKYEKAIDMLDSDWEGTYKKLTKYVEKYATSIDGPNSLKTSWEAVRDIMQECAAINFSGALTYGTNGENYGKNPSGILTTETGDLTALSSPKVYIVDRSGKSPSEAKSGDYIVTGGGIYIKGSNAKPLPLTPYIGKATTTDYAEVQKAYEEFKKRGIPTFHTGGIVGDGIKIGDKEVMTLLERGEWVLDGKRQDTLKEILAQIGQAATYATALKATSMRAESYPQTGNSFAPHVEVNIQHSGSMSDDDARHYGDVAADAALEKLRIAFNRRGL